MGIKQESVREDRGKKQCLAVPLRNATLKKSEDVRRNGIKIVKLAPGQHLKLEAIANKNTGRFHAKHNPTGIVSMTSDAQIKIWNRGINPRLQRSYHPTQEQKQKLAALCHIENAFYVDAAGDLCVRQETLKDIDHIHDLENYCLDNGLKGYIELNLKAREFHFTVEGVGSRKPESIVMAAIRVWHSKIQHFDHGIRAHHEARDTEGAAKVTTERLAKIADQAAQGMRARHGPVGAAVNFENSLATDGLMPSMAHDPTHTTHNNNMEIE